MKELFTPRGLLVRALVLAAIFAVLHLAGLRSQTSVLCATMQEEGSRQFWGAFAAAAYIVTYLLAVVVAPILAIAAGLLVLWNRSGGRPACGSN